MSKKQSKTILVKEPCARRALVPWSHPVAAYIDANRERHLTLFRTRLSDAGLTRAILEGFCRARFDLSGFANLSQLTAAVVDALTPREVTPCR
jgi:hypothetical protein